MKIDPAITGGPKTMVALFAYGGIVPQTHVCMDRDMAFAATTTGIYSAVSEMQKVGFIPSGRMEGIKPWEVAQVIPPGDALIDRCRAITARDFLKTDCEVLVMLDHDMDWWGAGKDFFGEPYEGDILHIARAAARLKAIVGAVVSKKARGQGVAVIWKEPRDIDLGKEEFIEVHQVGAAFTAYHRSVLQAVSDSMEEVPPGFKPIFLPAVATHPQNKDEKLHLSEDWALVHRAQQLGCKAYVSTKPLITHWGPYGYTVLKDSNVMEEADKGSGGWKAIPRKETTEKLTNASALPPDSTPMKAAPKAASGPLKISVIHPTRGRPKMAAESYCRRMDAISGLHNIEYIFAIDEDDESMKGWKPPGNAKMVMGKSRGPVDGYNRALWAATGDVVAQAHDDLYPPQDWDKLIVEALGDLSLPRVLRVDDGCDANPHKPWLLTVLNGSMTWFKKCGYFYWPKYPSVFCDDDISRKAEQEGSIIDAKHIKYNHAWKQHGDDETYKRAYADANWQEGKEVFAERESAGFPDKPEAWS